MRGEGTVIDKPSISANPGRGYRLCPTCEGRGWCEHCDGTGRALFDNKTRCAWCAGRGECPVCEGTGQLSEDHDAFRESQRPGANDDLVLVTAEQAAARGLAPISIRVDANAAGLFARPFPTPGVYLVLNGPPGGAIVLAIWDCSGLPPDPEAVIRAKLVPPWTSSVELGSRDQGFVLGANRAGMTFATGADLARIGWFGCIVEHGAGRAFVATGLSWRTTDPVSAAPLLAHASLAKAITTLDLQASRGAQNRT